MEGEIASINKQFSISYYWYTANLKNFTRSFTWVSMIRVKFILRQNLINPNNRIYFSLILEWCGFIWEAKHAIPN